MYWRFCSVQSTIIEVFNIHSPWGAFFSLPASQVSQACLVAKDGPARQLLLSPLLQWHRTRHLAQFLWCGEGSQGFVHTLSTDPHPWEPSNMDNPDKSEAWVWGAGSCRSPGRSDMQAESHDSKRPAKGRVKIPALILKLVRDDYCMT